MTEHPFKPGTEVWLMTRGYHYSDEPPRYTKTKVLTQRANGNVTLEGTERAQFGASQESRNVGGWRLSERGAGRRSGFLSTPDTDKQAHEANAVWEAWRQREKVIYHLHRHGKTMPDELVEIIAKWMHPDGWWKP
jgi:hypothetical protein